MTLKAQGDALERWSRRSARTWTVRPSRARSQSARTATGHEPDRRRQRPGRHGGDDPRRADAGDREIDLTCARGVSEVTRAASVTRSRRRGRDDAALGQVEDRHVSEDAAGSARSFASSASSPSPARFERCTGASHQRSATDTGPSMRKRISEVGERARREVDRPAVSASSASRVRTSSA